MEVKELQCFKVSRNFSILDSDTSSLDNDFAVVIRNGVHVTSLVPDLTGREENVGIRRTLITSPNEQIQTDITIDYDKFNRERFCLFSLDWKLSPILDKNLTANVYVRQIGFIDFKSSFKSLLGVINNHGCFYLYTKTQFEWKKIIDLSAVWKNHCVSLWSAAKEEDDFDSFRDKCKYLRIISFTCCQGFLISENAESLLLSSITENGVVGFWIIENETVTLINTIKLGISVKSLHWHYLTDRFGWIIAACSDGSVKIYFCKKNVSNEFALTLLHELWKETDQIVASHIKTRKQGSRSLLVFSKENALLLYSLQNTEIASFTHEFDKKIAGLEILDDSRIFVILSNHRTYNLSIINEKCVCSPIPFKTSSSFKKYCVRGISFSRNKVFCVVSLSLVSHFDPLILKEPHCLLLCTTHPEIEFSTMKNLIKEVSLPAAVDYIEFFRLCCLKNKVSLEDENLKLVWSCLNEETEDGYRNLQILYILSQCYRSCSNSDDILHIEIVFTICRFMYHISTTSDNRKQYYFSQWLKANMPKLPEHILEYKKIKSITEQMTGMNNCKIGEKCEICSADVTDHSNIKFIGCEKGHKVLRCARSFLPVTSQPHYYCSICNSTELKSKDVQQCVVCDNILST